MSSRGTDYQFVSEDASEVEARLIAAYENITQRSLQPSDPDRLFIAWVTSIIIQERVLQNYIGNQNLPSRAEGENLDALGEWIYSIIRLSAQSSKCTMKFTISAAQPTSIVIPQGTRVTDESNTLVWATTEDAIIPIGDTSISVMAQCETVGTIGNGYVAGQINVLIDVDNIPYYASCANTDTSDGGAEQADDEEYYDLMRRGLDSYSTAGPSGAYEYWAKTVSTSIADVKAIQPRQSAHYTAAVYTSQDNDKVAFCGSEGIVDSSIVICAKGSTTPATIGTDYSYTYTAGLLLITIKPDGALADEDKIEIYYDALMPGYVHLYALMDDGTIADSVIKQSILDACNADTVRPLTDCVEVKDAEYVDYNINFTYFVDRKSEKPLTDIQTAVVMAVNDFIDWQSAKIGRDINPSKLEWLLKDTGVKRVVITSPTFTSLRGGDDHAKPQVARCTAQTIVNGGYEDE